MGTHLATAPHCCEPPPKGLVLCLLGPPQVMVGGEVTMGFRAQKALALLAYLAVEQDRPHLRRTLAALFWPDQPEKRALQDLRQTLSRLRTAIGDREAEPPYLLVDSQKIQFNRQSSYWLDVEVFKTLLSGTERHRHRRLDACPACLARLAEAAGIYRGELLATFQPAGSPALDVWLLIQRERLQQKACVALQALSSSHLTRGEPELACQYARSLLHLDPWNENAQRLLLRALMLSKGRNAALLHYEAFRQALAGELRTEPEDRTLELVERIRSGTLADMQLRIPATQLPTPAAPFVGRETEREQIADYLASQDQRLIGLYGPGGCGKTRLALEVAAEQAPLWRDGVWFVPLDDVLVPEGLVDVLVATLQIEANGKPSDEAQLIDFLHPKESLLILDGFERLAADASLVQDIVRRASQVKILVTSRARLALDGERALSLEGLSCPAEPSATVAEAEGCSAVKLFLKSARRVAPGFCLSAENLPHIVRICRLVDGLPLGIELAAAWVRLFPCRQIADEIEQSYDFLQGAHGSNPKRHHSLRASFDYSYSLLSGPEQDLFRRLSVFRGGFTGQAAKQVTRTDSSVLASLLDKALIRTSASRRLDIHLTLRQYAAEKLVDRPEEEVATRDRHSHFYLGFLQAREGELDSERASGALDEIGVEIANVRAAWQWAVGQQRASAVEASIPSFSRFHQLRTLYREAGRAFGSAADTLMPSARANRDTLRVVCWLLERRVSFLVRQGRFPEGLAVTKALSELAQTTRDPLSKARGAFAAGLVDWKRGEYELAHRQLQRARSLVESMELDGAPGLERQALTLLGACLNVSAGACRGRGDLGGAKANLEMLLAVFSRSGNRLQEIATAGNLGVIAREQGEYEQAVSYYGRALRIEQELGCRTSAAPTNLGELHLELGAYAQAEGYLQQALAINKETGARRNVALVLGDLGLLAHCRGEDALAREHYQEALSIARELGDGSARADHWLGLGDALLGLDRLEDAAEAYTHSLAVHRELGQSNRAAESLAGLARVHQAQGDLEEARVHVEEILEHVESGGTLDCTVSPFQVCLTCYRVLESGGDPRARDILTAAHDQLQERAAKIADEEMQRSFLENVAAHRELVRAFERTSDPGRSPASG